MSAANQFQPEPEIYQNKKSSRSMPILLNSTLVGLY
jgi:hypothetical protein